MQHPQESARRDSVAWAAQVALERWNRLIGEPGVAAMRREPALLARVDQHAAEVRDAVADRHGEVSAAALAAYADGVADVATARGCDPAAALPTGSWARAPWPVVRLLAVCLLAAGTPQA